MAASHQARDQVAPNMPGGTDDNDSAHSRANLAKRRPEAAIRQLPTTGQGIAEFFDNSSLDLRAKLPIHGQVFETACRPLGGDWHPETADRLADLCGQRAGK
jgi:hypothetical protein